MRRFFRLSCLAALLWAQPVLPVPALADTVTIRSAGRLSQAIAEATPGQRIELAPGDYGGLTLRNVQHPADAPVVITSADPENPARLSWLDIRSGSGMRFEGLVFDYTATPDSKSYERPFNVAGSQAIVFRNNLFTGDDAPRAETGQMFPTGFGLSVRDSRDVEITGNEIEGFYRGLVVSQSQDMLVDKNDLHSIRMDGMNFAEVRNVVIEENRIHDFRRVLDSGDHSDMIQFWTNGTKTPSTNVVIRNNLLEAGQGWFTQSIFIRNEEVDRGRAGDEMFYRDFVIEGNRIRNAHLHGITTGETHGLIIRNNELVYDPAANPEGERKSVYVPQIRIVPSSTGVVVTGNRAERIELASRSVRTWPEGWVVADNIAPETVAQPAAARSVTRPDFSGPLLAFDADEGWTLPAAGKPGPIVLGAGESVRIGGEGIAPVFGATEIVLDLRLRAGQGEKSAGGILRIPGAIAMDIGERGNLQVAIETEGARRATALYAMAPQLFDGQAHDIRIIYTAGGKARLFVDGQEAASVDAAGPVGKGTPTPLTFGPDFNRRGPFQGEILRLGLKVS